MIYNIYNNYKLFIIKISNINKNKKWTGFNITKYIKNNLWNILLVFPIIYLMDYNFSIYITFFNHIRWNYVILYIYI